MKRLTILLVVLLFGVFSSASAQVPAKPMTFFAGGGISLPSTPDIFKDNWKMAFHGMGGLSMNSGTNINLMGKVEFHNFAFDWGDFSGSGGAITFVMFGGAVKYGLGVPMAPTKPFLIGGIGMANASIDLDGAESETKMYFEIGGGVDFNKMFVMARYVSVATEGDSFAYMPISFGFKF